LTPKLGFADSISGGDMTSIRGLATRGLLIRAEDTTLEMYKITDAGLAEYEKIKAKYPNPKPSTTEDES
jgi:hypothetical protein